MTNSKLVRSCCSDSTIASLSSATLSSGPSPNPHWTGSFRSEDWPAQSCELANSGRRRRDWDRAPGEAPFGSRPRSALARLSPASTVNRRSKRPCGRKRSRVAIVRGTDPSAANVDAQPADRLVRFGPRNGHQVCERCRQVRDGALAKDLIHVDTVTNAAGVALPQKGDDQPREESDETAEDIDQLVGQHPRWSAILCRINYRQPDDRSSALRRSFQSARQPDELSRQSVGDIPRLFRRIASGRDVHDRRIRKRVRRDATRERLSVHVQTECVDCPLRQRAAVHQLLIGNDTIPCIDAALLGVVLRGCTGAGNEESSRSHILARGNGQARVPPRRCRSLSAKR